MGTFSRVPNPPKLLTGCVAARLSAAARYDATHRVARFFDIETKQTALRVVGIDPGSIKMGFGLLEDRPGRAPLVLEHGVLCPKASDKLPARLHHIHNGLQRLIATYQPQEMALENVFVGRNVKAAFVLGQARGVALLAAAQGGLEVFEYAPTTVKKAVVGSGMSSKEQVRHMVCRLLQVELERASMDVSDALSLAICHLNSRNLYMRGLL